MGGWQREPRHWCRDVLWKRTDPSVFFQPAVISNLVMLKVLLYFRIFVINQASINQNTCEDREDCPG